MKVKLKLEKYPEIRVGIGQFFGIGRPSVFLNGRFIGLEKTWDWGVYTPGAIDLAQKICSMLWPNVKGIHGRFATEILQKIKSDKTEIVLDLTEFEKYVKDVENIREKYKPKELESELEF